MKELDNFRRFLNENDPPSDLYASELEKAVGFKVAPPSYNPNGDKLVIYPSSEPGTERFYDDKTSQRIGVKIIDGKFYIQSIFGYSRGVEPIAQQLGEKPGSTSLVGFSIIMPSGDGIKASTTQLKRLGNLLNKALKDEANAQRDFYKGWINPD